MQSLYSLDDELADAVFLSDMDDVRRLLDRGADPNLRDADGWTPLDVAVYRKALDLIWLLVHFGADVNAQDDMGISVLMRAVLASKGSPEVVDLLQRWGARADLPESLLPKSLRVAALARRFGISLAQGNQLGAD